VTFPVHFAVEILSGSLPPAIAAACAARAFGFGPWEAGIAVVATLYGLELALVAAAGFPWSWRAPFAFALRDATLPIMWIEAWLYDDFTWHGQKMTVGEPGEKAAEAP
jgi:ceramide glucosyltransferase